MSNTYADILYPQTAASQIAVACGMMLFYLIACLSGVPPLAAAILPLALYLTHTAPYLWCLLFMCMSYFRLSEAYPILGPLGLTFYLGILSLTAIVWHALFARSIRPFWTKELGLMVVLFAIAAAGVATSINRPIAYEAITTNFWKIVAISLTLAWLLRTMTDFRAMAWCILVSGSLVAAVAVHNSIYGIGLVEGNRVTIALDLKSPLGDPNDLAAALLFPFGFAIALMRFPSHRLITSAATITFVLTLAGIILTRSRGGLLGVMIVCLVIGRRYIKSRTALVIISLLVGAALFMAMGISGRESGGAAEFGEGNIDASSSSRLVAWRAAISMAMHKPLTGVGIDNFKHAFYLYTSEWGGRSIVAHSSWFGVLGETGLPGLVVFVAMIYAAIKSTLRSITILGQKNAPNFMQGVSTGCLAGLAGFCTTASFLSHSFGWPIYILIAFSAAIHRYVAENYSDTEVAVDGIEVARGSRAPALRSSH